MSIIQEALRKLQDKRAGDPDSPAPEWTPSNSEAPSPRSEKRSVPRGRWMWGLAFLLVGSGVWMWRNVHQPQADLTSSKPTVPSSSLFSFSNSPPSSQEVSALVLKGIVRGGAGEPVAILGNQIVKVKDRVGGFQVDSINERDVVLICKDERLVLKLQ